MLYDYHIIKSLYAIGKSTYTCRNDLFVNTLTYYFLFYSLQEVGLDDMLHNATMYQMVKKGCDNLVIKKIEYWNGKERGLSINGCKWINEEKP